MILIHVLSSVPHNVKLNNDFILEQHIHATEMLPKHNVITTYKRATLGQAAFICTN